MKSICTDNSTMLANKKSLRFLNFVICLFIVVSCDYKDEKVNVKIKDPVRHYYPIVQGQDLKIIVELENTSDYPFKISDIQTSCGCIVVQNKSFNVIPSRSKGYLELTYDSNKNIGLVNHFIYIYGNLNKLDKIEANFDVHVVPDALYTPDYEELFRKDEDAKSSIENGVEGNENEKGYYVKLKNGSIR